MSTPTAGPDDRSPTDAEFVQLLEDFEWTVSQEKGNEAKAQILSALRSARRDVARLEWVMASSYQGIMVEPHTVRPGLIAEGTQYGPYHVDATREGIDAAMPQ